MLYRSIYIGNPAYLKLKDKQLKVTDPESKEEKGSVPIEDIGEKDILPIDKIEIKGSRNIVLDEYQLKRYKNGLRVTKEYIRNFKESEKNIYKIYDEDENLISIGNFVDEKLKNMLMI